MGRRDRNEGGRPFDAPLDEALFRTTPPDGYKIQNVGLTKVVAAPVEKDLVNLFTGYAERSGSDCRPTFR